MRFQECPQGEFYPWLPVRVRLLSNFLPVYLPVIPFGAVSGGATPTGRPSGWQVPRQHRTTPMGE
jgi:hypothetical protein